jgi:REP element-mobilizing transposase RayT
MFVISKDSPAYYITSVTNSRLPVFQTSKLKDLVCSAIGEVRKSANILLFAYVIMPDHFHLLIGTAREPSEALRYVNGITSRRIIDYLKNGGFEQSLQKLRRTEAERQHKYSLWDHHPNLKRVTAHI